MRVVFLTHNYPRHAGDVAGAFLHPLAVALRARGVDLRVVAPSEGGKGGRDIIDGVPVRRMRYAEAKQETFAYSGTMASTVRSPQGLRALAGLIRALRRGAREELAGGESAVLHAHWWIPAGLAAPPEVPVVLTCHGSDVRWLERGGVAQLLGRMPLRRARVVTTVSRQLAEVIQVRSGVQVAEDAVQPMPLVAADRPWSVGGGGVVIIGRLVDQKRVDLAIAAFALARERGFGMPLTIVGDGAARAALKVQAGGLALGDAVRFRGELQPSEVPGILATADVAVVPALGEGFGLVAAEALMQGVPVIACSDGGGLLDVVPTAGGGRIVLPTAAAIAAAMAAVVSDPAARHAARAEGMRWRERLSPDFVAERCLDWYRRALNA